MSDGENANHKFDWSKAEHVQLSAKEPWLSEVSASVGLRPAPVFDLPYRTALGKGKF